MFFFPTFCMAEQDQLQTQRTQNEAGSGPCMLTACLGDHWSDKMEAWADFCVSTFFFFNSRHGDFFF